MTPHHPVVDPITLEVIRHGMASITDQIDANVARTAFSPYIYEYKDYAVGFVSRDGELLCQSTGGMPVVAVDCFSSAVRDGLAVYGADRMFAGDLIVCNHAAVQGQHLNNTVMFAPVFAGDQQLIGFFAINLHWIDIGGSSVGSITFDSTDIFMEGLQLKSVKLCLKGELIEEVYRIIEHNTRFPDALLGDIAAQRSGCVMGQALTADLANKFGVSTFLAALEIILDQSEAEARAKVRAVPDGTYEAESFLDDDGISDQPILIKVKVIIAGDEMTVDYSDIADQLPSCLNSGPEGGGKATARLAFKYLIAADQASNEGTFRPLKLILPPGKIISASPTAAMAQYAMPFPIIVDTIIKALEPALPGRVTGAHFGTYSSIRFSGRRPGTGALFNANDSGHGGWGASAYGDGAGPFRTMAHGDTRIIPIELQEALYPYTIEEFALREDSGGAGAHRGGMGFRKRYRIEAPCTIFINFDRVRCPPWGVQGGKAALSGQVTVIKPDGHTQVVYKAEAFPLESGDEVIVETGGGGGYGAPDARPPELLRRDLERGYVSREAAQRDYPAVLAQINS